MKNLNTKFSRLNERQSSHNDCLASIMNYEDLQTKIKDLFVWVFLFELFESILKIWFDIYTGYKQWSPYILCMYIYVIILFEKSSGIIIVQC